MTYGPTDESIQIPPSLQDGVDKLCEEQFRIDALKDNPGKTMMLEPGVPAKGSIRKFIDKNSGKHIQEARVLDEPPMEVTIETPSGPCFTLNQMSIVMITPQGEMVSVPYDKLYSATHAICS